MIANEKGLSIVSPGRNCKLSPSAGLRPGNALRLRWLAVGTSRSQLVRFV
jgi:hypothetical protein